MFGVYSLSIRISQSLCQNKWIFIKLPNLHDAIYVSVHRNACKWKNVFKFGTFELSKGFLYGDFNALPSSECLFFFHTKRDETRYNSSAKIEISPSIDVNDFKANESFALSGLHSCYLVKPNTHKQLLIRKWDGIPTIWIYIYIV